MARTEDFNVGLWSDPEFEPLSQDAALLYIWSWTNAHTSWSGLYTVGRATICLQAKVPDERLDAALAELAGVGWLQYIDGVMWVRGRVKNIRSKSRRMATSVVRDLARVPEEHPLRRQWMDRYGREKWLQDAFARVFENSSDTSAEVHVIPRPTGESVDLSSTSSEPPQGFHRTGTGTGVCLENSSSARAGVVDQHSLPDDFPADLAETAETVRRILGAIHDSICRDGSPPPTLHRIGLVMKQFPAVDHEAISRRLELWALRPETRRRGRAIDLVSAFWTACERPRAGGATAPASVVQTSVDFVRSLKGTA